MGVYFADTGAFPDIMGFCIRSLTPGSGGGPGAPNKGKNIRFSTFYPSPIGRIGRKQNLIGRPYCTARSRGGAQIVPV